MTTKTLPARHRSLRHGALGMCAILVLGLAACGGGGGYFGVGTSYGPYWYPYNYGTYSVVNYPWWGDPPPPPANDPMRLDSPEHRVLTDAVREFFASRGYRHLPNGGDVDVVVYASARPELDISGYTHDYDWKNLPALQKQTKFPKGTVVVDVLAPKTHQLLWRGKTVAPVSSDSKKYQADLRHAVESILAKYPKAKS